MSFTIHKNVSPETVADKVPPAMVNCIPPNSNLPEQFDLIVFTDSVVKSSKIDKAIKRLNKESDRSDTPTLFTAKNFTADCREKLEHSDSILASVSDFHWSDSRYEYIRTICSSKVKTPDVREHTKAEQNAAEQPATRLQSKSK